MNDLEEQIQVLSPIGGRDVKHTFHVSSSVSFVTTADWKISHLWETHNPSKTKRIFPDTDGQPAIYASNSPWNCGNSQKEENRFQIWCWNVQKNFFSFIIFIFYLFNQYWKLFLPFRFAFDTIISYFLQIFIQIDSRTFFSVCDALNRSRSFYEDDGDSVSTNFSVNYDSSKFGSDVCESLDGNRENFLESLFSVTSGFPKKTFTNFCFFMNSSGLSSSSNKDEAKLKENLNSISFCFRLKLSGWSKLNM